MYRQRSICVLTLILAFAHWPILFNDGYYADDWVTLRVSSLTSIDLKYLLAGAGHPIFFAYFSLANWTGAPALVMKFMALSGIILGANAMLAANFRMKFLTQQEAVAFALIVWTYPGYQMWVVKANAAYIFSLGLFCIGLWLLAIIVQSRVAWNSIIRLAALLVFFFSFELNSIMALYMLVVGGLVFAEWKREPPAGSTLARVWRAILKTATRYGDFVVLPVAYWLMLNIWFPRQGAYLAHYAVHVPHPFELVAGLNDFWKRGYNALLGQAVHLRIPDLVVLCMMTMIVGAGLYAIDPRPLSIRQAPRQTLCPLVLAPLVFVVAAMPYLVAGLRPDDHFYNTRHLLLFGVPLALVILAGARFAGERWRWGPLTVFTSVIALLTTLLFVDYTFLQARWLKQEALVRHLNRGWPQPPALVFNLDDGFLNYPARHVYFGISEITGALRTAWGPKPFVGFNLTHESPDVLRALQRGLRDPTSSYHDMDPSGPQATIRLRPGPAAAGNTALALRYYACRLSRECDQSHFVDDIAKVQVLVGPIPTVTPLVDQPNN